MWWRHGVNVRQSECVVDKQVPICSKSKPEIYRITSQSGDAQINQTMVWKSAQWPQSPSSWASSSQDCVLAGKAGSSSVWSHLWLCWPPSKGSALVTGGFSACPGTELCCPGLFSRAFVLLRGLCLHSQEPFQLWFYPPSAIFSSRPLICRDDFVGGTVQQDMFTGRGRTALALLRHRCRRNVVCLCFVLQWASAGHCVFCGCPSCF